MKEITFIGSATAIQNGVDSNSLYNGQEGCVVDVNCIDIDAKQVDRERKEVVTFRVFIPNTNICLTCQFKELSFEGGIEGVRDKLNVCELSGFLLKCEDDVTLFVNHYMSDNLKRSIKSFRQFKIRMARISFAQFVKTFRKNKGLALEMLFQEPVTKEKLCLIEGKPEQEIYQKFKLNTSNTITSLAENWDLINGKKINSSQLLEVV